MAKDFDIYLRRQLTECDLIIYSIPYHDGISITNRLILEAALDGYILQKFVAVQMDSELVAHIDDMIKLCFEKLNVEVQFGATADFETQVKLYMDSVPVVIDTPKIEVIERMINEVKNGIVLATAPLITQASSSTGRVELPFLVGSEISDILKHSLLDLPGNTVVQAEIEEVNQRNYIDGNAPLIVDSTLESLCYQLTLDVRSAIEITAMVLGTEIRHSLGRWYDGIAIGSKVTNTQAQKFMVAESIVSIMQNATGILQKVLYPDNDILVIAQGDVNVSLKRYRLLEELDDLALEDMDDMTLGELDYVELT